MKIQKYKSSSGRDLIEEFIDGLPPKERTYARDVLEIIGKCKDHEEMQMRLNIKPWAKGIFEVKFYRNNRLFYVYLDGNEVYIVHGLQKKSDKTPKKDSDIVRSRVREIKENK